MYKDTLTEDQATLISSHMNNVLYDHFRHKIANACNLSQESENTPHDVLHDLTSMFEHAMFDIDSFGGFCLPCKGHDNANSKWFDCCIAFDYNVNWDGIEVKENEDNGEDGVKEIRFKIQKLNMRGSNRYVNGNDNKVYPSLEEAIKDAVTQGYL
jgi:hypothetical protein